MNNNYLISLAASVIPILAIAFVGLLLLYKIYIKIRSKFDTTVNCWFCNQNARVPYLESNSWTCPQCEQYNGFTKDGDYNREIYQQLDCSNLSGSGSGGSRNYSSHSSDLFASCPAPAKNGFCDGCNEAQRLKVEKLAQFEPKNESRFDEELKVYKAQLEEQYRLCSTCDRHLNKVLREKKKMVLGSKFLDFIIKGAETFKQPHFNQIRIARYQHWKQKLSTSITILTILNIFCLISFLSTLTRDSFTNVFGELLGSYIFIAFSHVMALSRVTLNYMEGVSEYPIIIKVGLFFRTLFMMVLYSMGLKWPQIISFNFTSLYVLSCPFVLLSLAFAYNVADGFKLTRFTFLLAVWSVFAGGLVDEKLIFAKDAALLFASFATLVLSATCKNNVTAKLHDNTANSFHKMYSEDYLSDDETMSLISQHLNGSSVSMRSMSSNRSYRAGSPQVMQTTNSRLAKSPQTSSVLSLNNLHTRSQLSPNSSFKTFCIDDNQPMRPQYAASMCNFSTNSMPRSSLFASNLELSCRERPQSSVFGFSGNTTIGHNSTMANSSFLEPHEHPLRTQRKSDESFFTAHNVSTMVGEKGTVDAPLASPFSVSSGAVHQQRANNLITPSRFSTNCLASNASASSWLSGGYFNQRCQNGQTHGDGKRSQYLMEHRNGMTAIDENLSRASSQSSGFESQNGRLNTSRENSYCPDSADLLQRTITLDNARGFMPIDPNNGAFSPRPSLLSQSTLTQPLSVNCASTASYGQNNLWPRGEVERGSGLGGLDSFNFRKINEELPSIKRGDLLKKWKEGHALS